MEKFECIEDEELTYEILHEFKVEQDRLIAEGKIQRPQIVYGLSKEGQAALKRGRTLEMVLKSIEEKYGKI